MQDNGVVRRCTSIHAVHIVSMHAIHTHKYVVNMSTE